MAWMKAPGTDEIAEVPDEMVEHYASQGAKIVGPPEEPLEANPLLNPLELAPEAIGATKAISATLKAAPLLFGLAKRAPNAAGRFILRRIPVVREAMDVAEVAGELAGKKGAAKIGRKAGSKIAGEIKPKARLRPSAPKSMSAEEQAAARLKGRSISPTKSPEAMRGASGPALERRAAARAQAVARTQPAAEGPDLLELLRGSLEAQAQIGQAGLTPQEGAAVMAVLRQALGG